MTSVGPRLPYIWVPNAKITRCQLCNTSFSVITRKHHCRSCGQIFCSNCCYLYQSLPSYLPRTHTRFCDGHKHRVCNACHSDILRVKKNRSLILIMSLLPLYIHEFETLRCVSTKWQTSVDAILSVFKAIPYKISCQPWTSVERRLLLTHWKSFTGHSRLMTLAIRGLVGIYSLERMARHYKDAPRVYSCEHMYCQSNCNTSFTPCDILELICAFPSQQIMECPEMESWMGQSIRTLTPEWFHLFIPFIIQCGHTQAMQRIIANTLLPLASNDRRLAYTFYFECLFLATSNHTYKAYYRSLLDRFLSMIDRDIFRDLDASEKLLYALKTPTEIVEFGHNGARLPFAPHITVLNVQTCNVTQLTTFTAPYIVPIDTSHGHMRLLVKYDDLRKDRFVLNIVRIMNLLVGTSLKSYEVLPVTPSYGIVHMLPHCQSLFEINKTTSLMNYIIQHNADLTMRQIRDRFIDTCAHNCVMGYMLGVGDRNLGNILVCEDGTLVHIDFSYLLGTDPKWEKLTEMKITSGMVELLGGKHSEEYKVMKKTCTMLYDHVKRYSFFWYTLLNSLATSEPPIHPHHGDIKSVQMHVEQRLMPQASSEEVAMAITDILDSNSGSRVAGWFDNVHSFKSSIEDLMFSFSDLGVYN